MTCDLASLCRPFSIVLVAGLGCAPKRAPTDVDSTAPSEALTSSGGGDTESGDDDDDNDDDGDDDDDANGSTVPWEHEPCAPYEEPRTWMVWDGNFPNIADSGFQDAADAEGKLRATVSREGDRWVFTGGSFSLGVTWQDSTIEAPVAEGDVVYLVLRAEAGDDGCCDTEAAFVLDPHGKLLMLFAWNQSLWPVAFDGTVIEASTKTTEVCDYRLDPPPLSEGWVWHHIEGLSMRGTFGEVAFEVPAPGMSGVSTDGQYRVSFPMGHDGSPMPEGDSEPDELDWRRVWFLELVYAPTH